jgi:hypothetical protein
MSGESIEDQRLDLLKLSDQEMKKRYYYSFSKQLFQEVLEQETLDLLLRDVYDVTKLIDQEF